MTQKQQHSNWYMEAFERLERSLNGAAGSPLHRVRRQALETFVSRGFPTTRDEEWRYTNVNPIARTHFTPAAGPAGKTVGREGIASLLFPGSGGPELVFVDGRFVPALSSLVALPDGVVVQSLAAAVADAPERLQTHLAQHASPADEPFTALNTAFIEDGAYVHVPRRVVVQQPIHLLFLSSGAAPYTITHPRVLVVAEEASQVTVIESYGTLGKSSHCTNAVTEIVAGAGSHVDHYRVQRENEEAFHVSDLRVIQERDVQFCSTCLTLGGRLTRNHVHTALRGEGIDSTLNGLYLAAGQQHVDNHTLIEHCQPQCSSHEYYKGVLGGKATGVFRGQILVHQEAQKTDAYQANRNLLLSDDADINAKPQLEIYADDVKCSHGATVGQLDQDAVFYLRSRGIGQAQAESVLTRAFSHEIVDRIRVEAVRARLADIVERRLEEIAA